MFAPSALRGLVTGAPGALLAALFLAARLLASPIVMAAPAQDPVLDALAKVSVFCHAGLDQDGDGGKTPIHDHACLLCPACHVMAHVGLPIPIQTIVPQVAGAMIGRAGTPPPATGPPHRPRVAAQPTGPPDTSV